MASHQALSQDLPLCSLWLSCNPQPGFLRPVAEELLFRGFLLTALRQRLGSIDSVAVSGALFALMHLSVEQFFQFALLGFACGAACVAADSVLPAVFLHAGYNFAAVALALRGGS